MNMNIIQVGLYIIYIYIYKYMYYTYVCISLGFKRVLIISWALKVPWPCASCA